jgi:hypothetical protein
LKAIQIENYSIVGDRLDEDDELKEGQMLTNNNFYAIMQLDGNFALYSSSDCNENNLLWISKTSNSSSHRPFYLKVKKSNIFLKDVNDNIVWSTTIKIDDSSSNNCYLKIEGITWLRSFMVLFNVSFIII